RLIQEGRLSSAVRAGRAARDGFAARRIARASAWAGLAAAAGLLIWVLVHDAQTHEPLAPPSSEQHAEPVAAQLPSSAAAPVIPVSSGLQRLSPQDVSFAEMAAASHMLSGQPLLGPGVSSPPELRNRTAGEIKLR